MSWYAQITRYTDNDAEIVVHVDYFDRDPDDPNVGTPLLVHHEEAVFPAGTTKRKIREELAKRGRDQQELVGKAAKADPMQGTSFAIDDI